MTVQRPTGSLRKEEGRHNVLLDDFRAVMEAGRADDVVPSVQVVEAKRDGRRTNS